VQNVSVDGSRKVELEDNEVITEPSILDNYARRENLKGCDKNVLKSNFIQFVANYSGKSLLLLECSQTSLLIQKTQIMVLIANINCLSISLGGLGLVMLGMA